MNKLQFHGNRGFIEKFTNKVQNALRKKRLVKNRLLRCRMFKGIEKSNIHFVDIEVLCALRDAAHGDNNVSGWKAGLRRGARGDFIHDGTFHQAISPVLVMAQFFCLMPVRGVRARSSRRLSFRWKSFRTCYCLLYVVTTVIDTIFTLNMVIHGKLDARNIEPVIFHVSIFLASVGFLRLAKKWPHLMHKWQRVERQMPKYLTWIERESLARRIKMVSFVLVMLSLTEHLLSTISAIHFANYCPARRDPIESYFSTVVSQIFFIFEYSAWLAWLGKIQNVLMTFGWSYMDIFVSIMGIGLSMLFKRIQNNMVKVQGQPMPEVYWTQIRLQYRAICELIEEVDSAISGIIMLSFANNLYFVCMQLLKSMNKMPSVAHAIYFYFSLMFLIARTLAVSLFLADVNDTSRRPLDVLKYVPEHAYHDEVVRFAREVSTDAVALTGLKFFSITRKLALTVAGTIATYELVLIQFHEDQKIWNCGAD